VLEQILLNHYNCLKNMKRNDRRDVAEGLKNLEEVVAVAVYGNWLITFIDDMEMPLNYANRTLLLLESFAIIILILSLVGYFITIKKRSAKLWWLHLVSVIVIQVSEMLLSPIKVALKNFTFIMFGISFWILIHSVNDIRTRLNI